MDMTISLVGSCALALVVVVVRLAQDRLDRRHEQSLDSVKRCSEDLARSVLRNGWKKPKPKEG